MQRIKNWWANRGRPKSPVGISLFLAYNWNKWADASLLWWEGLVDLGNEEGISSLYVQERLAHRRKINRTMRDMDPVMYAAVTAGWPEEARRV